MGILWAACEPHRGPEREQNVSRHPPVHRQQGVIEGAGTHWETSRMQISYDCGSKKHTGMPVWTGGIGEMMYTEDLQGPGFFVERTAKSSNS